MNRLALCAVVVELLAEQFPDARHIGAVSPEESRGLKGSDAGLVLEIMGVNHNAGVHRIGLDRPNLHIVRDVLHDLCDHLAGARRIGLDIRELGIPNGILTLAVVIQHHNGLCDIQKPRALDHRRPVGIHDNKHRVLVEEL